MFYKKQLKVKNELIAEKTQQINYLENILAKFGVAHIELTRLKREQERMCGGK